MKNDNSKLKMKSREDFTFYNVIFHFDFSIFN